VLSATEFGWPRHYADRNRGPFAIEPSTYLHMKENKTKPINSTTANAQDPQISANVGLGSGFPFS
jgi:hypothetical protein